VRSIKYQAPATERSRFDRGLLFLIGGACVLIIVGLVSIPLALQRPPAFAPVNTPEGIVQRFYQAAYAGDYETAYTFLSAETQREISPRELQWQLSDQLENSQMRVVSTSTQVSSATIQVVITHVYPNGIFGSRQWERKYEILLQRDGETWKIVSGPFYAASVSWEV
jgi:hypothetical protein